MAVYTWEGNQVNITCEVFAYPSATISWFRDGQLLPSSNYSNIKIYSTPSASYLEVCGPGPGRVGKGLAVDRLLYAAKTPLASLPCPEPGATGWRRNGPGPALCLPGQHQGLEGRVGLFHGPLLCSSLWLIAGLQIMIPTSLVLFFNNLIQQIRI